MTKDRFFRAFALLSVHEGAYSNHPDDPGGATMKGVTQRTYDADRDRRGLPRKDVREISNSEVERIYRGQYWNAVKADDLPDGLAYCVFDAAVNSGPGRAARWLQQEVGAKVDGVVGSETIAAARQKDTRRVIDRYCDRRLAFMKRLRHWPTFKNGWTRRVSEVRAQSLEWAEKDHVETVSKHSPQPKAEGQKSLTATAVEAMKDRGAVGAATGLIGSAGALTSGDGPVQYAIAAVLVLGALIGLWWIVRRREA